MNTPVARNHQTNNVTPLGKSPPKKKLRSSVNKSNESSHNQLHTNLEQAPLGKSPSLARLENTFILPQNEMEKDDRNCSGTNRKIDYIQDENTDVNAQHRVEPSASYKKLDSSQCGASPDAKVLVAKPSGVSSSGKKKTVRRSKRRSSFITGRISKSFSVKTSDVFEDISQDLPQDQRLEMLHRKALHHVLDNLEESFADLPSFAEFRIKAVDSAETSINSLCERGEFLKDTTPPEERLINSAESKSLEENIRQAETQISRYNAESERWDQILAEYKELAEQAERLQQSAMDNPVDTVTPVPNLSKSQQALLDDRINVKALYTQLQTLCERQVLSTDAINHKVKLQTQLFREAKQFVQEQSQKIAAQSFPNLETDPRVLIKNATKDNGDVTHVDEHGS